VFFGGWFGRFFGGWFGFASTPATHPTWAYPDLSALTLVERDTVSLASSEDSLFPNGAEQDLCVLHVARTDFFEFTTRSQDDVVLIFAHQDQMK
jgi:hypothetical protein